MPVVRYWWATGLGLVALFVALAFWDPAAAGSPDLCLFHRATGVACPACGLTRGAAALAQGQFAESWRWHPMVGLLGVEAALFWLAWGLALLRERSSGTPARRPGSREPSATPAPTTATGTSATSALGRFAPGAALATGILLLLVWLVRLTTGTLPA